MIQRIQTLFLFLAFMAAVAVFFFPLAGIYSTTTAYKFYIYELRNMTPTGPGEEPLFSFMTTLPLLLLNILVTVFSVVSIFLYKNRVLQAKIVRLAILMEIVLIALIFFVYANIIETNLFASPDYLDEAGIYFPLITLIFLILANRAIMKDEKLVRSIDRLR